MRRGERHGFYFSLDALFAAALLVTGLVLISQIPSVKPEVQHIDYVSKDILVALSTLRVVDLGLSGGMFTLEPDANNTILAQIGEYWATNRTDDARLLAQIVLNDTIPRGIGFNLSFGDELIFSQNTTREDETTQIIASRRMISGIADDKPLTGTSSTAYLRRITGKRANAYTHFGGFVGQGNLTVYLGPLPDELTSADITDVTIVLDTVQDFNLYINGQICDTLLSDAQLYNVQAWNLTDCKTSIGPGMNVIRLESSQDIDQAYIAGGYLRVQYLTTAFQETPGNATLYRYRFPGIKGVINLYDGVALPGIVSDFVINITFTSNYSTYFVFGNETMFSVPGQSALQTFYLERHNLGWPVSTLPIRFGTHNFSNSTEISSGQPADAVIVTDVSGSMDECGSWYPAVPGSTCSYRCCAWLGYWSCISTIECPYTTSCTAVECGACPGPWPWTTERDYLCDQFKMEIAQTADKLAASLILNVSGNKVGLVSYDTHVDQYLDLTTDINSVNSHIDSYASSGNTCTCCGINLAKEMIRYSPNKRFMVVMSDGDANYYCADGFGDYTGTSASGNLSRALNDTIASGQNACINHNITVYTIGFGTGMSAQGQATLQATACNTSLYFNATNVSQLADIYRNITQQILLVANFSAQTIIVNGTFTASNLSPESYIDFTYQSAVVPPTQNEILVKTEVQPFSSCQANVTLPIGLRISQATVGSYSGQYWTSGLLVNGYPAFNLADFSSIYQDVGDPFLVAVPVSELANVTTLELIVADTPANSTNCSDNSTFLYEGYVNSSIARSAVLPRAEGCQWTIEFDDGHFLDVSIPAGYSSGKQCNYTSLQHDITGHDHEDAYDYAVYELLRLLDFDQDGRVFVNLQAEDLEIIVILINKVPYLWGPSFAEVRTWQ